MLIWTEPEPPNDDSHYDHVMTETPLGRIVLEWKSWKDYDTPCGQMPWGEMVYGHDLAAGKSAVQDAWNEKIMLAMLLVETPDTKKEPDDARP